MSSDREALYNEKRPKDLLPCSRCGDAWLDYSQGHGERYYYIKCKCSEHISYGTERLIENWNERNAPDLGLDGALTVEEIRRVACQELIEEVRRACSANGLRDPWATINIVYYKTYIEGK